MFWFSAWEQVEIPDLMLMLPIFSHFARARRTSRWPCRLQPIRGYFNSPSVFLFFCAHLLYSHFAWYALIFLDLDLLVLSPPIFYLLFFSLFLIWFLHPILFIIFGFDIMNGLLLYLAFIILFPIYYMVHFASYKKKHYGLLPGGPLNIFSPQLDWQAHRQLDWQAHRQEM